MQKQTIKKLKKISGCAYPECSESVYETVSMPIGKMNEFGLVEFVNGDKDVGSCSLCKYHYCLAEQNIINLINQNEIIILTAPWPNIELIENMLEAKDMFKKLKKNGKKNKKAS